MSRQRESRLEVVGRALREFSTQIDECAMATGDEGLRGRVEKHLMRLPRQYALDVSFLDDILAHMELLSRAESYTQDDDASDMTRNKNGVCCTCREVDVQRANAALSDVTPMMEDTPTAMMAESEAQGVAIRPNGSRDGSHSRHGELRAPTFGSSVTLTMGMADPEQVGTYEIAVSARNKPRLLSRVSASLFEVGLNIAEAHVFCTDDGLALDIFIVTGWRMGDAEAMQRAVQASLESTDFGGDPSVSRMQHATKSSDEASQERPKTGRKDVDPILIDGGEWELTERQLVFNEKIASGAFGLLYRGSYCGQEVAIKVLKSNANDSASNGVRSETIREFAQELSILRRVHHKNIIQLIGALTKQTTMCLVTDFMHGGNLLQHVQEHPLKLPELIRHCLGVAMGLDYLHKINIIHRDIKTANLLLDENLVVKIADFGVARTKPKDGSTMTAETGTYRWMAPEVIAHQHYDEKADVFSYGVMVWELVSGGEVPYPGYTPLQAAVGVVQRGLRPTISPSVHPVIAQVMQYCWNVDPTARPSMEQIMALLRSVDVPRQQEGKHGFLDRLRSVSFKSRKSARSQ